jgi:hypothetical protein
MEYKVLKAQVKEIFEKDGDFKEIVKRRMGNWTQFDKDTMKSVIDIYALYSKEPVSCISIAEKMAFFDKSDRIIEFEEKKESEVEPDDRLKLSVKLPKAESDFRKAFAKIIEGFVDMYNALDDDFLKKKSVK